MLIIFAGLPGVGKTTIAKDLARCLGAVYLRADTIEQPMRVAGMTNEQIGGLGYSIACSLSCENLRLGRTVVIDSVNPWLVTREMYRNAAIEAGTRYLEVEVVCSDRSLHRFRAESRTTDVVGLCHPSWQEIEEREYHPWDVAPLRIDAAKTEPTEAVSSICRVMAAIGQGE